MALTAALMSDLIRVLSTGALVTDAEALPGFGQDFRAFRGVPGVVVRPQSVADVTATLHFASAHGVPVVPRAAGTNLASGFLPTPEQILLDLRSLDQILRIDHEERVAVVQPGVINGDLNARLAPLGLSYAPDPASAPISTIGGNIAANAGGPHCLKYGATFHHVREIAAALADGEVVRLAARDAGPDLLGVMIGSEGTLAIVVEASLALRPLPETTCTLLATFSNAEGAAKAVTAILAAGVIPAALEYADAVAIQMFDGFAPSGYPADAGALLLVDLDGTIDEVAAELPVVDSVLRQMARTVQLAEDPETRAVLWRGRLHAAHAIVATGKQHFLCDTTVPPSRLPALQHEIAAIAARHRLEIPTLGHAGDGNLHPIILFASNDPAQQTAADAAHEELTAAALALGGTITGEHGIGSEKRRQMLERFGPAEIAAMRAVKAAFDRMGLLNPGMVLPELAAEEPRLPRFAEALRKVIAGCRHDHRWSPNSWSSQAFRASGSLISIDAENRTATIAANTPLSAVHAKLDRHGLATDLPNEPVAVGAVVSNDNAAREAVRNALLAVRATLPDGSTVHFGGNTVKDVAGYDLKRLYTGGGDRFGELQEVTFQVRSLRSASNPRSAGE